MNSLVKFHSSDEFIVVYARQIWEWEARYAYSHGISKNFIVSIKVLRFKLGFQRVLMKFKTKVEPIPQHTHNSLPINHPPKILSILYFSLLHSINFLLVRMINDQLIKCFKSSCHLCWHSNKVSVCMSLLFFVLIYKLIGLSRKIDKMVILQAKQNQ